MGLPRQHKARGIVAAAALTVLVAPCFLPTCYPVTSGETGFAAGAEGATAPETLRQKDRVTSDIWKEALTGLARMRPPTG